jgi:uncharacterized protein with HEPN domain
MARPTLADRLRHILDAIADVQAYTEGKSFDDYLADDMRRHAVERCLEIVSEASRYVPREAKASTPEYPGVASLTSATCSVTTIPM